MTIKELKNLLNKYDENTRIKINDSEWGWGDIDIYLSDDENGDVVVMESDG